MESGTEKAAQIFKALGDPTRLSILREIAARKRPICVMKLVEETDVSQSAVSQHLKTLKNAGLVSAARSGYHVHYRLAEEGLNKVGIDPSILFRSIQKKNREE